MFNELGLILTQKNTQRLPHVHAYLIPDTSGKIPLPECLVTVVQVS